MGKKKPQKTKELSVAIAEASSTGDEAKQQPQLTPRKRGRPRKFIEEQSPTKLEQEEAAPAAEVEGFKKAKASEKEEEEEEDKQDKVIKEEGGESSSAKPKESDVIKREPSRSRARRKSKPRKSSR